MTGSLQIKNGKYYVVIRTKDAFGKSKQKWIATGIDGTDKNKRKAEKKKIEILVECEKVTPNMLTEGDILFTDWIHQWIERKKDSVKLNTYEGYTMYFDIHIKPFFEPYKLKLKDIKPIHIQTYYDEKKKTLKGTTLIKHQVVIKGALKDAVWKEIIPFNPAERVILPKQQRYVGNAYSAEYALKLLGAIKDDQIETAVILGLFYGLRRSEVAGLRWKDIDFSENMMHIRNTVVRTKTTIEAETTKSMTSQRTLVLVPETIEYFQNKYEEHLSDCILFKHEFSGNDHVCSRKDCVALSPSYISHRFHKVLIDNDLPIIRFHDLRHTIASLLITNNTPAKQVQEYLGHKKVSTTLDIYGHLNIENKKDSARIVNNILQIV